MKQNKKTMIAAIAAAVALAVIAAVLLGVYFATREKPVEGAKTVTVTVVHSNGSEKAFTYHTDEEYLGPVLLTEGLITGEEGPYGLYIHKVDGEQAIFEKDNAYWALYIGEEMAMTGVSETVIHDGDSFKLVYTGA